MSTFYLALIGAGVIAIVVVFIGLLNREPGDKPWKWVFGGVAALLGILASAFLLFRKGKKGELEDAFDPPEKLSPTEEEVEALDKASEELDDSSEEARAHEEASKKRWEELHAKKDELDKEYEELDKRLEEAPPGYDGGSDDTPDPKHVDYIRNL